MPTTSGFNHVATMTADLARIIAFYEQAFDARVTWEVEESEGHPRQANIDLGGGASLNVAEVGPDEIVGDRRRMGHRGPIDHYGLAVDSLATLEKVRDRLDELGADIGEIQQLGDAWSLFFRDPDGMELEVCAPTEG